MTNLCIHTRPLTILLLVAWQMTSLYANSEPLQSNPPSQPQRKGTTLLVEKFAPSSASLQCDQVRLVQMKGEESYTLAIRDGGHNNKPTPIQFSLKAGQSKMLEEADGSPFTLTRDNITEFHLAPVVPHKDAPYTDSHGLTHPDNEFLVQSGPNLILRPVYTFRRDEDAARMHWTATEHDVLQGAPTIAFRDFEFVRLPCETKDIVIKLYIDDAVVASSGGGAQTKSVSLIAGEAHEYKADCTLLAGAKSVRGEWVIPEFNKTKLLIGGFDRDTLRETGDKDRVESAKLTVDGTDAVAYAWKAGTITDLSVTCKDDRSRVATAKVSIGVVSADAEVLATTGVVGINSKGWLGLFGPRQGITLCGRRLYDPYGQADNAAGFFWIQVIRTFPFTGDSGDVVFEGDDLLDNGDGSLKEAYLVGLSMADSPAASLSGAKLSGFIKFRADSYLMWKSPKRNGDVDSIPVPIKVQSWGFEANVSRQTTNSAWPNPDFSVYPNFPTKALPAYGYPEWIRPAKWGRGGRPKVEEVNEYCQGGR